MSNQPLSFTKATKKQARLRLALIGPSGSGKTFTALTLAQGLGERVAVIDTERGSASKYADLFTFDVLELHSFSPLTYADAIVAAVAAGYPVIVVDSLSHAWMGKEGALEQVDRAAKRSQSSNNFAAWREVTPMHNQLVDTILQADAHIIATMRTKTEYVVEANERGKMVPRKIGMAPVQRDGLEYEFDIVGDMDLENNLIVSKTRMVALAGAVIPKPGAPLAEKIRGWLTDGTALEPPPAAAVGTTTNGNGHPVGGAFVPGRPYAPEALREMIRKNAGIKQRNGKSATQAQVGLTASSLEMCFAGADNSEQLRHCVQEYLIGTPHLSEANDSSVLALLDWLKPTRDEGSHYAPDPMAAREAGLVAREFLKDAGQAELDL